LRLKLQVELPVTLAKLKSLEKYFQCVGDENSEVPFLQNQGLYTRLGIFALLNTNGKRFGPRILMLKTTEVEIQFAALP